MKVSRPALKRTFIKDDIANVLRNFLNTSKVVDENGEPMVVYHGTNLTVANKGVPFWTFYEDQHFGTKGQAEEMARAGRLDSERKVYEVFLNIRNMKRVKDAPQNWKLTHSEYWEPIFNEAKADGYDGLVYLNEWEDSNNKSDSFVVFEPSQIKSATDNTGSFDPNDPDIRYRVTPEQDEEYMAAVEAGDMEAADRMVRDAARSAGYNLEAYHGTDVDFNEFKRRRHANGNIWGSGFYFADSEDAAAGWGESAKIANRSDDYEVLHTYLSVHNPFELYGDRLELGLGEYAEDVISRLDPEYDADIIEAIRTETPIDDYRGESAFRTTSRCFYPPRRNTSWPSDSFAEYVYERRKVIDGCELVNLPPAFLGYRFIQRSRILKVRQLAVVRQNWVYYVKKCRYFGVVT